MQKKINRRGFLKVSAQGAAVASLAGVNAGLAAGSGTVHAQTLPGSDQGKWVNSIIRD